MPARNLPENSKAASEKGLRRLPREWPQGEAGPDGEILRGIQAVCLDIDDTLSSHGKLTAEAYTSLWALKEAGFWVVPITGRPAGWCDHFARFWPVDAVVGENGAFTFYMEEGIRRRLNTPAKNTRLLSHGELVSGENPFKNKIRHLEETIRSVFPQARWASDQAYREYDLAIDVCEDVTPWPDSDVKNLLELCQSQGAHAKLSSIHVNAWFGDYDKLSGFEHWLTQATLKRQAVVTPLPPPIERWLFIGDSPNDEPIFKGFRYSVGVANLKKYLDQMTDIPTWITSEESGKGFSQMARQLVLLKKADELAQRELEKK